MGSVFALSSAFFWAVAVILFKKAGDTFSPITLNIYKSIVAMVLISITMIVLDIPIFPDVDARTWWVLSLSGFLGITLADVCFFTALNRLGASMVAVVECLYLPCVLFFSFILLGERMGPWGVFGSILVMSAILVGSIPSKPLKSKNKKTDTIAGGIFAGVLAMVFLALGIVIAKDVLDHSNVFWATLVRVVAGCISLAAIVACHPKRRQFMEEIKFSKAWVTAFPASVCGNYIALLFWVAGMKYTTASRAAVLNQMCTIFIFILAWLWLKEKMTGQKIIAICLAVTGAYLAIIN
ncbi:MAG: DMT family transporter [Desulfobacterales bacterium]|nr:DMT family transporter [Desulfobacterales bacterium]